MRRMHYWRPPLLGAGQTPEKPGWGQITETLVAALWLPTLFILALLFAALFCGDRRSIGGDAIVDLPAVEEAPWEATASGPSLTGEFRFADTRGRTYECRRISDAVHEVQAAR